MLCWGRGFVYVSTGKEKQWIPSKMIKIRDDRGRPLEDLSYRQKKKKGNKKNHRNHLDTELQTHQGRICNQAFSSRLPNSNGLEIANETLTG